MSQTKHDALSQIDGNVRQPTVADPLSDASAKPVPTFSNESQQHQSLHSKLMRQQTTGQQSGSYISPSDNIMSPASAKLNAYKQSRLTKTAKPRSLFQKATSSGSLERAALVKGTSQAEDDVKAQ